MGLVKKAYDVVKNFKNNESRSKRKLLKYIEELKKLESRLWGVTIKEVSHNEEIIVEDVNHLIYLFGSKNEKELKKILNSKEIEVFAEDLKKLHKDFLYLKKKIKDKNKLRDLISSYTILLVERKNYTKLEQIFLLEKQLYEVIDTQEKEFDRILKEGLHLSIEKEKKVEIFLKSLKEIREILAGHLDYHSLWEEERHGYSNTSNILHTITKLVKETV